MKSSPLFPKKTKRKLPYKLFILFISLFIFALPFGTTVFADSETDAKDKLNQSVEELLGGLDLTTLNEYLLQIDNTYDGNIAERITKYIKGESFDYDGFLNGFLSVVLKSVRDILPAFACIIAVALLSGIISALKSGPLGASSVEAVTLIAYISALIPLLGVLTECFSISYQCVNSLQKQMQIVYPILLTLMATSGGTVSVAVCRPAVAFFSTNIVAIITSLVFPLTVTIICFSVAGNLSKELKINKFSGFFKSINKWVIGVCISVFGIFFTLQGITTASYDGIVRRATKYAIGNGIPIVGGFLSGGFDLAVASSVLIKNALGSLSIFMLATVLFEPLILLIATNLLLRFTAAVTQPLGDSKISDFLGETADNLHYCTAGLLLVAFLYFLSIMLFVSVSEALF